MKKLIVGFLLVLAMAMGASSQVAAPVSVDFHGDDGCHTDPSATIAGWGIPAIGGGYYGGKPYSDFCLVWEPTCQAGNEIASVDLAFSGGNENIVIDHLDGQSNLDSFDVLVDGNYVGHYTDTLVSSEDWVYGTEFPVNVAAGVHTVTLEVTDPGWPSCDSWGQLAISHIAIEPGNDIPEFGVIAAAIAMIGAIGGIIVMRRH